MQHSKRFIELVADAKTRIQETDVQQVKQKLGAKENFHLVDVREQSEWAKDHLPHAIHLSKGVIEVRIEKTIPDINAEIILYCGGGNRSALVADNLQKMGYTNVKSMAGGYRDWVAADYPLITDPIEV